jgi:hypothetical protein
MADTVTKLVIKDGTGASSGLSAISSSTGYSSYHALTGTLAAHISSSLRFGTRGAGEILDDIDSNTSALQATLNNISGSISSISTNFTNLLSGSVSASIDIITGDTNIITSSLNNISSSLVYAGSSLSKLTYDYTEKANDSSISAINTTNLKDGTKRSVSGNSTRKSLLFFNHTNGDVYLGIGATSVTASSGIYTYAIATSGSYASEHRYAHLEHNYSGSSTCTTGFLTITEIEF